MSEANPLNLDACGAPLEERERNMVARAISIALGDYEELGALPRHFAAADAVLGSRWQEPEPSNPNICFNMLHNIEPGLMLAWMTGHGRGELVLVDNGWGWTLPLRYRVIDIERAPR